MAASRKKRAGRVLLMLFLFLSGVIVWEQVQTQQEEKALWQTEASTSSDKNSTVLLGGMPVGIYMETDGVMVLSTEKIKCTDGNEYEPAVHAVETGDYITAVNHHAIEGKEDLLDEVEQIGGEDVILTVRRGDETIDSRIRPVEYEPGQYRLGIWVRDNVQGLGTITFLTEQSRFGALGHGISDSDTGELVETGEGSLYTTKIMGIEKGSVGSPGLLSGVIYYGPQSRMGEIEKNTNEGIFGTVNEKFMKELDGDPVEIAKAYDKAGLSEEYALQQARVARILRAEDYDFHNKQVKLWRPDNG